MAGSSAPPPLRRAAACCACHTLRRVCGPHRGCHRNVSSLVVEGICCWSTACRLRDDALHRGSALYFGAMCPRSYARMPCCRPPPAWVTSGAWFIGDTEGRSNKPVRAPWPSARHSPSLPEVTCDHLIQTNGLKERETDRRKESSQRESPPVMSPPPSVEPHRGWGPQPPCVPLGVRGP